MGQKRARARATPRSAFRAIPNLGVIVGILAVIVVFVWSLPQLNQVAVWTIGLLLVFLAYHLWAINSRSIEVDDRGITRREAFWRQQYAWDEIEAIAIERWRRQLSLKLRYRRVRLRFIGMDADQLVVFLNVVREQAQARRVPLQMR